MVNIAIGDFWLKNGKHICYNQEFIKTKFVITTKFDLVNMNLYECVELNIAALLRLKNYYQFYPQLDKGYSCLLYLNSTFQLLHF